ncbi:MAG: flagellar hook protein FlgE [Pseudomonadota bacterium]|nr:flagellar hook protein FlgE [Pseudomonadota bacterium]
MSILGAMLSGVSGLNAQSEAMSVIANNISNVNTVGYKANRAAFSSLVTQTAAASGFASGGVRAQQLQLNDVQGLLQKTGSATDLGIDGNGFFVVNEISNPSATNGQFMFTRAGQFIPDENGNLRNAAGLFLQGWPIDAEGNITSNRTDLSVLDTVNIHNLSGSAEATTTIDLRANLQSTQTVNANIGTYVAGAMASGAFEPDFEVSLQIFDSQGGARNLSFGFLKSAGNQWLTEAYVAPAGDVDPAAHPNGLIASGLTAFNADGTFDLAGSTAGLRDLNIQWAGALGLADSQIAVDLGSQGLSDGLTQFSGASQIVSSSVNGAVFGSLSGVEIGENGVVTALFDNGTRQDIYKIPVAVFPNPNGLGAQSGNAFIANGSSGNFTLNEAGTGAAGFVTPSAVETSTVDLAQEFTDMIQTQRAFSANGRIITTADEMLDELVRLKR